MNFFVSGFCNSSGSCSSESGATGATGSTGATAVTFETASPVGSVAGGKVCSEGREVSAMMLVVLTADWVSSGISVVTPRTCSGGLEDMMVSVQECNLQL